MDLRKYGVHDILNYMTLLTITDDLTFGVVNGYHSYSRPGSHIFELCCLQSNE